MNKRILIWIIIGVVLISGCVVSLVLIDRFMQEESIKELTPPQIQALQKEETISTSRPEEDTTSTLQPASKIPILGIYEVCSEITGCEPETGIKKIKEIGANAVIITVVDEENDEDNFKSVSYYPSQYLPMVDGVPKDYFSKVVNLAHQNNIKVYASINLPHNYWLAKHPDWIAVWSNGQRADTYEADYFHRVIPPSRIIAEKEAREFLQNIIAEVVSYGVDGIDINDNFQFSDEYLEETETTLYSSFDDFTIKKFQKDTNVTLQGGSPQELAGYIKDNADIYEAWLKWRAEQVTLLLRILKQNIKDTGSDIPIRPHLLTWGDPYEYYGLDYEGIAKEVDVLYLMITPEKEKEKYFEIIKKGKDTQVKQIAVSTYLFEEENWEAVERDKEKILERMSWIREAGADEIYLYNFRFIEEGNLWTTIKSIFDHLRTLWKTSLDLPLDISYLIC